MYTSQKGISVEKQKGHKKIRTKKSFVFRFSYVRRYREIFFFKKIPRLAWYRQRQTVAARAQVEMGPLPKKCPDDHRFTTLLWQNKNLMHLFPLFHCPRLKDTFKIYFLCYIRIFNAAIFVEFPRFQVRKGKGGGEEIYEDKLIHDFLLLLFLQLPPQSLQKKDPFAICHIFRLFWMKNGIPLKRSVQQNGENIQRRFLGPKSVSFKNPKEFPLKAPEKCCNRILISVFCFMLFPASHQTMFQTVLHGACGKMPSNV